MSTRQRMRSLVGGILVGILLLSGASFGEEERTVSPPIWIVPKPVAIASREGDFELRGPLAARVEPSAVDTDAAVALLASLMPPGEPADHVVLTGEGAPERLGEEGYVLDVESGRIVLRARAGPGFFYGMQTLRQLLPPEIEERRLPTDVTWRIPGTHVEDHPRFTWRGFHLDVGRHFMPPEDVKRFLDVLAFLKMNTFHWHLTEDQGWRIEIKRYPRLIEVGSRRAESPKRGARNEGDGTPYAGHYTQEEIREVVAYAAARHITIVPEIEMPGHAQAAIAAYPELGNTEEKVGVRTRWGVSRHVYNVEDSTFEFLENVLVEVMDLFPGTFVHIGGDECPKHEWKASARAQARRKAEGLADEHELQSWFIRRIERFLASHGRRLIGWDEIQEGGLPPGAAMMVWRSMQYGIDAVRQGHDVVMCPTSHCYLDYCQGAREHEPEAIGGFLPVERVYAFEPVPEELTPEEAQHVLGAQGNLWTEYMHDMDHVLYMALPRGAALAEVVWTPRTHRDLADFRHRWRRLETRLARMGVPFRREPPRPVATALVFRERGAVAFELPGEGRHIRFTLDGSIPTAASLRYRGPIAITTTGVVTAAVFDDAGGEPSVPVRVEAVRYAGTTPAATEPGLVATLYQGAFSKVPEFTGRVPVWTKPVDAVGLGIGEPDERFALRFAGFLEVRAPGVVSFALGSDDGSVLSLAGVRVIDNDGLHGYAVRRGSVHLEPGVYPLEVGYFERGGGQRLTFEIDGPVRVVRETTTR